MAITDSATEDVKVTKEASPAVFKFPVQMMVQYISTNVLPEAGAQQKETVLLKLKDYYDQGYELFETHYIGQNEFGIGIVYILKLRG